MSKDLIKIKMVHAEVMQEAGLSLDELPTEIQSKIRGFNLMKTKLYADTNNKRFIEQLTKKSVLIADEIENFINDNLIHKEPVKIEDDLGSRTIDISDLAGTYTLNEMPNILDKIQAKIDEVKNKNL
jgi:hypothetical protein